MQGNKAMLQRRDRNFLKWWWGAGGLPKDGLKHMQRREIGGEKYYHERRKYNDSCAFLAQEKQKFI